MLTLRDAIQGEARRLGFSLFGVTTPEPLAHFALFQRWLGAGRHGEMAYLASERSLQRRADPLQILPECRSIIVLGTPYHAPAPSSDPPEDPAEAKGEVAAYAWGEDYHAVLVERMKTLVAFIEARVGAPVPNRCYTDSGPLLERDLAQRAGLGWIGKNTCLISPERGSYFLLAEILLGLDLPPDLPFMADRCGSCTRCLEACPTACILPDRTLDARRCISYLTIELKGSIPVELRPRLGDWVFGCDICQQVCPWNQRFALSQGDPAFEPRPGLPAPVLTEELSLTQERFSRKFKGSSLKRARRKGYLRNVAVALGNHGDSSSIPILATALKNDPEPLVRRHAAWSLGRIGGEAASQALQRLRQLEEDPEVLAEIDSALSSRGGFGRSKAPYEIL